MPVTGVSGCAGRAGELSRSLGFAVRGSVHSFAENLAAFHAHCVRLKSIRRRFFVPLLNVFKSRLLTRANKLSILAAQLCVR